MTLGVFDAELFPDDCEVLAIPPHSQFVYLMQKNGNSSLRQEQQLHAYDLFRNEQISKLDHVDVYIRNPRARYVSGVNTYLQHLQRDYPTLDYQTAFWFAKRYNFLNRHYLPQFHWLYNLSRFMRSDAKIRLRDFRFFGQITSIDDSANVVAPTKQFVEELLHANKQIEFWWQVDRVLLDLSGSAMTWQEIIDHYKMYYPDLIRDVLPKT